MIQRIHLVLFTKAAKDVTLLRLALPETEDISIVQGFGPGVTSSERLDALWVTGMQAHYFGAPIITPGAAARVFQMEPRWEAKGLPPWYIAGSIPLSEEAPTRFAKTAISMLMEAVDLHNGNAFGSITRIGSIPENFGIGADVPSGAALAVLADALVEHYGKASSPRSQRRLYA